MAYLTEELDTMHAVENVRGWAFDELHRTVKIVGHLLTTTPPADLTSYRDGGDGWTALEVVCHLRDWELIFLERAKLMLNEDMPDLPNPDPDQAAVDGQYMEQNINKAYEAWAKNRADLLVLLEKVAAEDWERAGMHPRRGHFTLHNLLFLTVWHDTLHIEQIIKIVSQKL
jgi:hypothetical protein